ncbi:hypothetical protein [Blastococcus sp. URHD0036]|uniref:hypothetical protein n=1 Tax=Blastococcus sp. URHD0036 TaxID=1380356 RepID=UPI0012DC0AD3|nr:hypothetical protein [Blastococcus sp. URHD0036]
MQADESFKSRPSLTVMPEYTVDLPVWHGPEGHRFNCLDAEELAALGVSAGLIDRLRAWQQRFEREHPPFKTWYRPDELVAGVPMGVRLARQLQAELPGYRIYLPGDPDPVPVEDWPG